MASNDQVSIPPSKVLQAPIHVDLCTDEEGDVSEPPSKKFLAGPSPSLEATSLTGTDKSTSARKTAELEPTDSQDSSATNEFRNPAFLARLRNQMKANLQTAVTQAVNAYFTRMSNAVSDIEHLKKSTSDLEKRVSNLETTSRKIEALVRESVSHYSRILTSIFNLLVPNVVCYCKSLALG